MSHYRNNTKDQFNNTKDQFNNTKDQFRNSNCSVSYCKTKSSSQTSTNRTWTWLRRWMRTSRSRNSPCSNNKNKLNSSSTPSINATTKSPSSTLTSSPTHQSFKLSTYLHSHQPPKKPSHNPILQPFPIPSRAFHNPWPNSETNTRPWNCNRWTSPI